MKKTKYIHAGQYVAAVEVELSNDEGDFSPCISVEDARLLDDVRRALLRGDIADAAKRAKVYTLLPVAG